ncbi:DUF58 domain-containing protein [Microbacterium sp. G2-8]|uniref:DUF58 domain-containing protein n=1 Tax=Microbacterium sp. G2-8 TaxID=2842454 RepID=UPI0021AAC91B|nr:DUF58 domain-containing protein [Microbacterium sp. G2-8]
MTIPSATPMSAVPAGMAPSDAPVDPQTPEFSRPEESRAPWWRVAVYLLAEAGRGLLSGARVIRPIGWMAIIGAIVLWILGPAYGWREMTTGAIVLTVIVVVCALFLIGRTGYDVALDLHRDRVIVGEHAEGGLILTNPAKRPIAASRVVLPVGEGRGIFAVRRLAAGESETELFQIPTHRRGVLEVGPVSVLRGDPLGLFERIERKDDPTDLYVHPRTVRFEGESLGFVRDLEGLPTTDLARDDISFHALTEYQPGDDLRHVHWRSSARTGTLMMRTYEQTRRSHFVIAISRAAHEYRTDAEFELAVSIAASIGRRAMRDSFEVDLRTQSRALRAGNERQMLDSLSDIEPERTRERIDELGAFVGSNIPSASFVVLVTGRGATATDLKSAAARIPPGARTLVCVADEGADPELRRIADAHVVSLGTLDQLPRVLRKALA